MFFRSDLKGNRAPAAVNRRLIKMKFEFFQKLADLLTNFKDAMGTIVVPLGALAVAFCAFKIIQCSNDRDVSSAKSWLIVIIIGVLLFYFAEDLISSFASLAQS